MSVCCRGVTERQSEDPNNTRVPSAMSEGLADIPPGVDGQLARIDQGFAEMCANLDGFVAGQQELIRMLGILIERKNGPHDGK